MTDDKNTLTLCVTCDAPPSKCSHTGHRYYDQPVKLMPLQNAKGETIGSLVHPDDKQRWDAPLFTATPPEKPTEQPRPIQQLIIDLEQWIDVTHDLERKVRNAYDHAPLRVTRAVTHIVTGSEAHRLNNPAGLLVTRLREIQTRPAENLPPTPEPELGDWA